MKNRLEQRRIAVANEKGGVGKTVMAINLGAAFSTQGKRVLIVDMDPQSNASKGLGIDIKEKRPSVYDLIKNPESLSVNQVILKTRWDGLDLIPSHVDLAGAEIELVDEEGREYRLKEALEGISGPAYDFILIDTPPSLSLLTVNVFACVQEVIVPCQTHPYSFEALEELFDTVSAIQEEINPDIFITGIVGTFFDGRTRVSRGIMDKLTSDPRYRNLVFKTVIRMNTTIADSAAAGSPVVFYRKGSYGYSDFMDLSQEILQRK
jgi:chromosome partitioning protein